jgi:putative membrane protein
VAILVIVISAIINFFKYYNYKLTYNDNLFKYEYGLLSKSSFEFNKSRINALYVERSLLYRLFDKYSLEVSVIGIGDDIRSNKNKQKESKYLLPIGSKKELENILKILNVNEFRDDNLDRPVKHVILNLIILPLIIPTLLFIFLLTLVMMQENMYYLIITNVIFIYLIILFYFILRYKYHSYKLKDKLLVRSGAFTTSSALIEKKSIQQVSFNNGPIRRLLNIGNASFHYRSFLKVLTIKGLVFSDFLSFSDIVFKENKE